MLTGLDLSNHNETPDLVGLDFVIVKVSEGATFKDGKAGAHAGAANAAGVPVGFYHFLTRGHGAGQAERFCDLVEGLPSGKLMPTWAWLDVEPHPNPALSPTRADVDAFLTRMDLLGVRCGVYTAGWYWRDVLGNPTNHAHRPLWWASWVLDRRPLPLRTLAATVTRPPVPTFGGWSDYTVRQISDRASHGAARLLDGNISFGLGGDHMDETTLKRVLNEATGSGQLTWAGTVKETLRVAQEAYNAATAAGKTARTAVETLDRVEKVLAKVTSGTPAPVDYRALAAALLDEFASRFGDIG